ncbi:MAG: hypothetical protein ACWA6X_07575 [Bauldia sp.]
MAMIRAFLIGVVDAVTGRDFRNAPEYIYPDSDDLDAREGGGRYARGNVPMQLREPAFVTTGDLERERADLTAHPIPG